jgi:hypothetical protein
MELSQIRRRIELCMREIILMIIKLWQALKKSWLKKTPKHRVRRNPCNVNFLVNCLSRFKNWPFVEFLKYAFAYYISWKTFIPHESDHTILLHLPACGKLTMKKRKSCRKHKSENGINTHLWIYQRWDQVPRRSKYPLTTGHTRRELYFQIR